MTKEAQQVFDGVMLSDGALVKNPRSTYFIISLSGTEHLDWLYSIRETLAALGVSSCRTHPKVFRRISRGVPYNCSTLATRVCSYLSSQYLKWYRPNGPNRHTKVVPEDILLTPTVLANWYMGDGCSTRGYIQNLYPVISVHLATAGFSPEAQAILTQHLGTLGVKAKLNREGKYYHISISQRSVDDFMELVEPHIVPSFQYKIKRLKEAKLHHA